jgi:hypothetical protein
MSTIQYSKWVRFIGATIMLIMTGCIATGSRESAAPFRITMNTPNQFVVNDTVVDASNLVKTLKKSRVSQNEPLMVEMTASFSFDTIKVLTQKLATAGYKPIFKSPRHADASVNTPGVRPASSRVLRP